MSTHDTRFMRTRDNAYIKACKNSEIHTRMQPLSYAGFLEESLTNLFQMPRFAVQESCQSRQVPLVFSKRGQVQGQ